MKDRVDVYHEPKRAEDFSTVARIGSFAMKWQWVIWVLYTVMLAIGFNFKTPAAAFAEVRDRVIAVETRQNEQETRMARALTILEGLAIDACDRLRTNQYARTQLACKEAP